jgi:hypothetical protein
LGSHFDAQPDPVLVSPAQFARLDADPAIRAALRDPRLQRVIREVDGAPDRAAALAAARAREGRHLADFIDRVLIAIGACERLEDGSVQFIGLAATHK